MEYDIRLVLTHTYHLPAGNGRHVVRVVPRALGQRQQLKLSMLTITPQPSEQFDSVDFSATRPPPLFMRMCTAKW